MKYIDAHCHLQFDAYNEDRDQVIADMHQQGIHGILVGVDYKSSKAAAALAEAHTNLYATIGLHPLYVPNEEFDTDKFDTLVSQDSVVGIGECGLDYFRTEDKQDHARQKEAFQKQIEYALKYNKALMIHARPSKGTSDAYHDLIEILSIYKKDHPNLGGNVHFFVGGVEEREALNALDFTVSVTSVITFADDYNEMIRTAPHDMVLAETDAPYATPVPHRGIRNTAAYVPYVYETIATLWDISPEEAQKTISANTRRVFSIEHCET